MKAIVAFLLAMPMVAQAPQTEVTAPAITCKAGEPPVYGQTSGSCEKDFSTEKPQLEITKTAINPQWWQVYPNVEWHKVPIVEGPRDTLASPEGRVIMLSDDEYTSLEAKRKALKDEEERIARSHGAIPAFSCVLVVADHLGSHCYGLDSPADHYEYRGRYLLINVPEAK